MNKTKVLQERETEKGRFHNRTLVIIYWIKHIVYAYTECSSSNTRKIEVHYLYESFVVAILTTIMTLFSKYVQWYA